MTITVTLLAIIVFLVVVWSWCDDAVNFTGDEYEHLWEVDDEP